ncbi:hypothetical protein [Sulfuricurvum sp.]|uniref:hypothetical protein n=1 Tax=Sulfuricurvum sp. TaxID=2025608 RepID=UPI003BAE9019
MQKIILILALFLNGMLCAESLRSETENSISYRVSDTSFEEVQLRINNELQVNAFNIAYEINIAKALSGVSKSMEHQPLIVKGVGIGFCKPSATYKMVEKSVDVLLYCPFRILIVETQKSPDITVSFLKNPRISEKIDPKELDEMIENIISSALN